MRDYRERNVDGCIFDIKRSIVPKMCDVTVRMTSDDVGQSLSLSAYNIMIQIPLEQVQDIIKVTPKKFGK